MIVTVAIIVASFEFKNTATKMFPLIAASFVFAMAAIQLIKEISAQVGTNPSVKNNNNSAEETPAHWYKYLPMGAWVVGFVLASYLAGFLIAVPLFILSYMKVYGSKWLTAAITAALFTAFIYSVFELALEIPLYGGLFLN